jgi:SAM-dependent methyltransferase
MAPTRTQRAVGVEARAATGGATRLAPKPWRANYVHLRALSVQLRREISGRWTAGDAVAVLDVGCGERPYEPFFADFECRYVGLDANPGPTVDVVGTGEELPFDDAEFDCVLCTQVLQYIQDPHRAVREMHRVLRPGGVALISTHGISFVDRSGADMWRWTQHGLRALAESAAPWTRLKVYCAAGVFSAAAYLAGSQAEFAAHRVGAPLASSPVCLALNVAAYNGDRLTRKLFPAKPPDASANYLLASTK